jgi:ligand-binding SRPBCC domain-containing protein
MREVDASRFVRATPTELHRALTPEAVVEYEGSFTARAVRETGAETVVTVGGGGLEFSLRFESRDDGLYYTQEGDAGPFETMETWVTVEAENEGSRVTMRSAVSLGLPAAFLTDRVAGWKRRGELRRALQAIDADLG